LIDIYAMRERFLQKYRPISDGYVTLGHSDDRAFEQSTYRALLEAVEAEAGRAARVTLTPRSSDRGRDIVISNLNSSRLLGFSLFDGNSKTVFVECKRVGGRRLDVDHVASNILQINNSDADYFLLVTNATLTPRSISLLQDHCLRVGVRFLLADGYNLLSHFPNIGPNKLARVNPNESSRDRVQVSYQALPEPGLDRGYTVHIVVRSFSTRPVVVSVLHHSTREWTSDSESPPVATIPPHNICAYTFRLRPKRALLRGSARFALTIDGQRELFDVKLSGRAGELIELPLLKTRMVEELNRYSTRLRRASAPRFLHLHAPSGTGKTRFLTEVTQLARDLGRNTGWFRISSAEDVVTTITPSGSNKLSARIIAQQKLASLIEGVAASSIDFLVVDDVHNANIEVLQALQAFAFSTESSSIIIVAGRSDVSFRQAEYEAMARLVAENGQEGNIEQLSFSDLTNKEVEEAIHSLFPSEPLGAFGLRLRPTSIRAVDLAHIIHSLLERRYIFWSDENTLSISDEHRQSLEQLSQWDRSTIGILDYRYEHLSSVRIEDFLLVDVFGLLSLVKSERVIFEAIKILRSAYLVPDDILRFWIEEDVDAQNARFSHDTIREYLANKAYTFDSPRHITAIPDRFPVLRDYLGASLYSLIALHGRDFDAASRLLASFAAKLRCVTNISSLRIAFDIYNDLGSLIFLLLNSVKMRPTVLYRAVVARAYLNTHALNFAEGFLDSMRLMTRLEGRPANKRDVVAEAAVRQLMAHALQNSGDAQTSLTLMHGVENSLRDIERKPRARAIEFDMCDRLQCYYSRLAALTVAQGFFRRARISAHLSGDQALVNMSLSAEFHLYRYLDCEEAERMAVRQHRHSISYAPIRARLHAELNELVAQWTLHGARIPDAARQDLERLAVTCRESGFGHLIPRLEYLAAVDAYHGATAEISQAVVLDCILRAQTSAVQYGYGEYVWLCRSLRLLLMIDRGSEPAAIVRLAVQIIDELRADALSFVADDYLCYQNTVVLSNALHAIHDFADDEFAWAQARKISFSPLMFVDEGARDTRLREVFFGALLCQKCDPRAVSKTERGYFTILV
jgi:hypothetical protein